MAVLEMIGVASLLPFITVLTNPELIDTNFFLNNLFNFSKFFGVKNNQQFLYALAIIVFILLLTSISFKAILKFMQIRFAQILQFSLSKRLMERYLSQPYEWFLNQNSADFSKSVLSEVAIVIGGGITPLIELIAKSAVAIALIGLLIAVDPTIALTVDNIN
jgi:ABC-type bacteriocin/lantibiotic exporter with double-glycine peptidase domain